MGTIADLLNTAMRDFQRYSGDGLPNEPAARPLPVGDPASGQFNPPKKQVRDAFLAIAERADDLTEAVGGAAVSASISEASANTATSKAGVATLAAIAAGATLYDSIANGLADTVSGDVFLVQTEPGVQVHRNDTGSATFLGWLGEVLFDNEAALYAHSGNFAQDTIVRTREEGFAFKAAAPGGVGNLVRTNQAFVAADVAPGNVVWRPRPRGSFTQEVGVDRGDVSYSDIIDLWESLRTDFPSWVTRGSLGNDQSGTYSIYKYVMTPEGGYDRTVIIDAGIHGGERMNMLSCYLFFRELAETWGQAYGASSGGLGAARQRIRWVVVPSLNPWGLDQATKDRKNSRGVDLNRNFDFRWSLQGSSNPSDIDYRGTAAESEAETQILVALADEYPDAVAAVSLHDFVGPLGPSDCAVYFPDFSVARNTREIIEKMGHLEKKAGISHRFLQTHNASALNMYAGKGMNSCNPEWAFNFTADIYGSDDVTAALTFYGNLFLAYAFAAPANQASSIGPRMLRLRPNFALTSFDVPANLSFTDFGPEFEIDTSGMQPGIVRLEQMITVKSLIASGGSDILIDGNAYFGMDGAQRFGYTASGSKSSITQYQTVNPDEHATITTLASVPYFPSDTQRIRYKPGLAFFATDGSAVTNGLRLTTFEVSIWLIPTDGAPAMDVWRTPSLGAAWEKDPNFA